MAHFPVTSSTLSAFHLGNFLQSIYDLSPEVQCTLIRAGINDTYQLTDSKNRPVFRVYSLNWRSKEEITEEIRLLNFLKQCNIPVSYPIIDKNGDYIQTLAAPEGERLGIMLSYGDGQKVHDMPVETHFEIGALMAKMHVVTNNLKLSRVTYSPEVLLVSSLESIQQFLSESTAEMKFMRSTQEFLLREFSNIRAESLREGIVHLDFWFDNLNITGDNKVTLFDFDFCGNGPLCLDIAYYIMQLHNIDRYDEKGYGPKVTGFLNGYESITKISEEEKRVIPILGLSLYFFYLGVQCRRYENWSNSFLSENYLKRYIN
jgi:Ser/Thr protein kinase RdoA (MazF antagonist)